MDNSSKWEFLISGPSRDFRVFSSNGMNKYFNISGGIDHWLDCPNDDFRLQSIFLDDVEDTELAWQVGLELASLYNGAQTIINKNAPKIKLDELLNYGNNARVPKPNKINVMSLLSSPSTMNNDEIREEFEKSLIQDIRVALVNLATEREDVYLILKYFDLGHDWSSYYKILESIEAFMKFTGIKIEIDKVARKTFTNTANNYQFSGIESRHGFKKTIKKNKTPSMSLEEAHDFLSKIAKQYLNEVLNTVRSNPKQHAFQLPD